MSAQVDLNAWFEALDVDSVSECRRVLAAVIARCMEALDQVEAVNRSLTDVPGDCAALADAAASDLNSLVDELAVVEFTLS